MQLQSGGATDEDLRAVPGSIASDTIKRIGRNKSIGRRQALNRIGLFLLAGPAI